eukprot:gene10302-1863_t
MSDVWPPQHNLLKPDLMLADRHAETNAPSVNNTWPSSSSSALPAAHHILDDSVNSSIRSSTESCAHATEYVDDPRAAVMRHERNRSVTSPHSSPKGQCRHAACQHNSIREFGLCINAALTSMLADPVPRASADPDTAPAPYHPLACAVADFTAAIVSLQQDPPPLPTRPDAATRGCGLSLSGWWCPSPSAAPFGRILHKPSGPTTLAASLGPSSPLGTTPHRAVAPVPALPSVFSDPVVNVSTALYQQPLASQPPLDLSSPNVHAPGNLKQRWCAVRSRENCRLLAQ